MRLVVLLAIDELKKYAFHSLSDMQWVCGNGIENEAVALPPDAVQTHRQSKKIRIMQMKNLIKNLVAYPHLALKVETGDLKGVDGLRHGGHCREMLPARVTYISGDFLAMSGKWLRRGAHCREMLPARVMYISL